MPYQQSIGARNIRPNNIIFQKYIYLRSPVLDAGEKPEYPEGGGTAEASLDWKTNGHTALRPGIEPGISSPQCGGSTATLPRVLYMLLQNYDKAKSVDFLFVVSSVNFVSLALSQNQQCVTCSGETSRMQHSIDLCIFKPFFSRYEHILVCIPKWLFLDF